MKTSLRLVFTLLAACLLMTVYTGPSFASSVDVSNPATVLASSYQAMDAAMNATNPVRHPSSLATTADKLLSPTLAAVSNTVAGKALYIYDIGRISVLRSWAALHTHDYSAVVVWSTFQPISQNIGGTQAIVKGDEVLHIDATIQDNGQVHHFSPAKQAAQDWIKRTGHYLAVGDTNHETAIVHHTATLLRSGNSWVIESDNYWDPLAQPLAPDHHTLLKHSQAGAAASTLQQQGQEPAFSKQSPLVTNISGQRQAAINYAERWALSRNPTYGSYPDTDCANYVSQILYDPNGANFPGDSQWYSVGPNQGSFDFVNAGGLFSYMFPSSFTSLTYGEDRNYNQAATDDSVYEYPGDLIFYDWGNVFGFGPADGSKNHVAISVDQDANGYTYEDSHTTDLKHAAWDLGGGTQSGYWFMIMTY